jgi:plasmid maintenance system antidote protein VapI
MLKRAFHPGVIQKEELAELEVTPTEYARHPGCKRPTKIVNNDTLWKNAWHL